MQRLTGTIWMVASAISYGTMNISAKLGAVHLSVWQTGLGRFMLGAALIPILAGLFQLDLFGRERRLLLARGVCGTLGFLLMVQAYKRIPLSLGMVLFYLWPVFACLLSSRVAGEPTSRREWPFVIGALLGTVLILWPGSGGSQLNAGHFMALAASFFTGLAAILIRRLRRVNNPFTIYFYFCVIGGLLSVGPLLTQEQAILPAASEGWFCVSAVAVFAMAGQVLMNQGMKYLNASRTGALMMIEVIVAGAFGALFLSEAVSLRLVFGSIMILGCGCALTALPVRMVRK